MLLDLEIQGIQLVASVFLVSKFKNMQKIMPAHVLELKAFPNLVLACFQQPETNSASRAVFGPLLFFLMKWLLFHAIGRLQDIGFRFRV